MRVLFHKKFLDHNIQSQYEGAYRLEAFSDAYEDEECDGESYMTLIHPKDYVENIKNKCLNGGKLAEVTLNPASFEAAKTAVGLSVMAAMQGDFAAVRPPGHHAGRNRFSGFCFFNNMAIATQLLVNKGKKVFIFDFDGHHGDGTQEIFYDTDQVYYTSIHQAFTYPFTGNANETGEGIGKGYTLNIPIMPGSGEKLFFKTLDTILDAARTFEPDIVAVSAGFDGFTKDNLLALEYRIKTFYECGFRLRRAFPNVFAILEGGYHHRIKDCVEAFVNGVNVGSRPIRNRFDHNMSIG